MAYNSIRLTAYEPDRDAGRYEVPLYRMAFPPHWRKRLLEIYRLGKHKPETIKGVPIQRLNEVFRLATPDLLTVARGATIDDDSPWLYARVPLSLSLIRTMVMAWVRDLQSDPKHFQRTLELQEGLDFDDLRWDEPGPVDLTGTRLTDAGWVEPEPAVYQLLPDELARRIRELEPYRLDGVELSFRIAPRPSGAELVSWPPRLHTDEEGDWYFSVVVAVTVQTIPFADDFRVHIRTSVRRWCTQGAVTVPYRRGVAAYLLTEGSWLENGPTTDRFALGSVERGADPGAFAWRRGGPEGMLARLRFARDLPDAGALQADPARWLRGDGEITAAVAYSTMMGQHGVGSGLMPRDRAPLAEWAEQALPDQLRRVADPVRGKYAGKPRNLTPKPAGETAEEKASSKSVIHRGLQDARRRRLASVLNGQPLRMELFWQSTRTRDGLIEALRDVLGLDGDGTTDDGSADRRVWHTDKLDIHVRVRDAGKIAAPLDFPTAKRKSADLPGAIRARRRFVSDQLTGQDGAPSDLCVIEVSRKEAYWLADPKFAIRLGAADAGRLTKFIEVGSSKKRTNTRASVKHRAQAVWLDALRQLGAGTVPDFDVPGLPSVLRVVALWMVKRRADGPTRRRGLTPIAVRTDPDGTIRGWDADVGEWVSYRDLQLALTRQADDHDHAESFDAECSPDLLLQRGLLKAEQREVAQHWIKTMIYSLRDAPTLLVTHAQNTRSLWPWLGNGRLTPEQIQFGTSPGQRASLYGEALYHVHIRDGSSDETAQWFAPGKSDDSPGLSEGLWLQGRDRVFLSTAEKPGSAKKSAVAASKLVPRENRQGATVVDTGENAWNPGLVEVTAVVTGESPQLDAELLASAIHQLRHGPDYNSALKVPYQMHLAKRATQYVLPADDEPGFAASADDMTSSDPSVDDGEQSPTEGEQCL